MVILFPFAVMISTAIKPRAEILTFPPVWLPKNIRLQNFVDMWHAVGFGQALVNSALVSGAATILCLLIAIPAAYATAWTRFRGKRLFRQFLLITQMLSPVVLVLGIFRLMATLGLVDQLWALVLAYAAFNLAFAIWMLQAYFGTIPKELEEAARLDGASTVQRLRLVLLPLAAPALGVTAHIRFSVLLERIRFGANAAPVDAEIHADSADFFSRRRTLLDRMGSRHGSHVPC